MKTNKFILLLLLLFAFCGCEKEKPIKEEEEEEIVQTPASCFPEASDKYTYPSVPNHIGWDIIKEFSQLPDSVLESISTFGLVEALIHAPLFASYLGLSSSAPVNHFNSHYTYFNSAQELFTREDASEVLVDYFMLVDFDCIRQSMALFTSDFERLFGLECLLIHENIIYNIEHIKKKEIVAVVLKNYEKHFFNHSIPIMANIMFADGYEPLVTYSQQDPRMFRYLLVGVGYINDIDNIVAFAKDFIKE